MFFVVPYENCATNCDYNLNPCGSSEKMASFNSRPRHRTRKVSGGRKFSEIKVLKTRVLMIVTDWKQKKKWISRIWSQWHLSLLIPVSVIYKKWFCVTCHVLVIFLVLKAGEFLNAETIQEPIRCSKPRCLRLPSQLVPKEIHFFSPLTINQCFALVLAGTALSVVVTVTAVGLLCV